MIEYLELACTCPDPLAEGFSAYKSSVSTTASTQIIGWSVASPYFTSDHFDATAGEYSVPETGLYSMEATISYNTNAAIAISLGSDIDPYFVIMRSSPTTTELVSGLLPLLNIDLALFDLRGVLGGGTVTLSGEVYLTKDDVIGLYYADDGMTTVGLTLKNIVWSAYRLT